MNEFDDKDEREEPMMNPYLTETLPDLGIDEEEFDQLNEIVLDKQRKEQRGDKKGCCGSGFLCRLFNTYDTHFLLSLGLQYFNNGMKVMLTLAFLDIFKVDFALEPADTQFLMSVMTLPWTPKLFYGILADTFPICKSRKRSYIIIMGLMQGICSMGIPFILEAHNSFTIVALGTMISFSGAFMDVVVDGLMVCQARLDPDNGSEELQAYSWALVGIGGVLGGIIGGELTYLGMNDICFFIMGFLGFLVAVSGCMMNANLEQGSEKIISMTLCQRSKLNLTEIWQGFKIRELYRSVIFFLLLGAVIPSFTDFFYYYQMDVTGFSKWDYAMFGVLGNVCLFGGTLAYNQWLKDHETRSLMVVACLTNLIGAIGSLMFCRNILFGMDPYWFMMMSSAVTDVLYNAFVNLPGMVLFAKLIPGNIESSMFALLTGLMNFSNLFAAKMLGNYVNSFFGVTQENLHDLWQLYVVQIFCCLIPVLFICLLPKRIEVEQVQRALEFKDKQDQMTDAQAEADLLRLDPNVAIRIGCANNEQRLPMPTRSLAEVEQAYDDDEIFMEAEQRDPIRKLLNASNASSKLSLSDC